MFAGVGLFRSNYMPIRKHSNDLLCFICAWCYTTHPHACAHNNYGLMTSGNQENIGVNSTDVIFSQLLLLIPMLGKTKKKNISDIQYHNGAFTKVV